MTKVVQRGVPLPSGDGRPIFDVIWPRVAQPLDLVWLDEGWAGFMTHWLPDEANPRMSRSALCIEQHEPCALCPGEPRIWQGYAAVYSYTHRCRAIVVISQQAAKSLWEIAHGLASVQGQRLIMHRKYARPNAPVVVEVSHQSAPSNLPLPHPITPTLSLLFRVSEANLIQAMPVDCPVLKPTDLPE
jgi:hypothetical protein